MRGASAKKVGRSVGRPRLQGGNARTHRNAQHIAHFAHRLPPLQHGVQSVCALVSVYRCTSHHSLGTHTHTLIQPVLCILTFYLGNCVSELRGVHTRLLYYIRTWTARHFWVRCAVWVNDRVTANSKRLFPPSVWRLAQKIATSRRRPCDVGRRGVCTVRINSHTACSP